MVSVPSGYVWEKELACWTCHRVFTEAASPAYQIPLNVSSGKHSSTGLPGHKH